MKKSRLQRPPPSSSQHTHTPLSAMLTCRPSLGGKMVIDELVLSSLSPNISEPSASPAPHDAPQPPRVPRRERPTHCQFRLIRHRGSAGAGAPRAESLTDKEGKKNKKANKQMPANTSPSRTRTCPRPSFARPRSVWSAELGGA